MKEGLGRAEHVGEDIDGGDGAQLGCAQDAHDDGLCMSAIERAIAAGSLAIDDGGPNGLLGEMIGGLQIGMIEEQEERLPIGEQMKSEANALVMKIRIIEEPVHRRFD